MQNDIYGKWVKEHKDGSNKIEIIDVVEWNNDEKVYRCAHNPLRVPSLDWLRREGWVKDSVYKQHDNPYKIDANGNALDIRNVVMGDDRTIQIQQTPDEIKEAHREQIKEKFSGRKSALDVIRENENRASEQEIEQETEQTVQSPSFQESQKVQVKTVTTKETEPISKEEELVKSLIKFKSSPETIEVTLKIELPLSVSLFNSIMTNTQEVDYNELAKALIKHSNSNVSESFGRFLEDAYKEN